MVSRKDYTRNSQEWACAACMIKEPGVRRLGRRKDIQRLLVFFKSEACLLHRRTFSAWIPQNKINNWRLKQLKKSTTLVASCVLLLTLSLSARTALCDILQLWQFLLSLVLCTGAAWRIVPLPGGLPPCRPAPFTHCTFFSPSPSCRPSHLVSMGQPSTSYLSQADVSENSDLQLWLLGNGELGASSDWKPAEQRGHGQGE